MDRSDERKGLRQGDVLGLGEAGTDGTVRSPRAHEPDEERRRKRMRRAADRVTTGTNDLERGAGATGIDMGSGGEGTDVE